MLRPALLIALAASPAGAEPRVLADIPPIHSLVAQVMAGAGEPALILPPGAPVHESGLSPSEAGALAEADLVVWAGPALLPWLAEALPALAPEARSLALLDQPGWEPLPLRAGAHLAGEAHEHGEDHGHDEPAHEEHDHAGGGVDPHAWLDPAVAAAWLPAIAEALAEADPANAALYRANAESARTEALALGEAARTRLAPLQGRGYAVGHDALQYFERATGLPAAWALAPADGAAPSPGTVASLRAAVEAGEVACVLTDPETGPGWAATLTEGTAARSALVDPEGTALPPGPGLYARLVEGTAEALAGCLAP